MGLHLARLEFSRNAINIGSLYENLEDMLGFWHAPQVYREVPIRVEFGRILRQLCLLMVRPADGDRCCHE